MRILVVYVVCVFVGQAISVGIGLLLDSYSQNAALAAFIIIYYAMYWVAWRVALLIVDRSPGVEPDSTDGTGGSRATAALWLLAPAAATLELCD
ncbi:MAG: hypothetical protein WEA28_14250 [Xanthobacteraceae bacterium]